jgi:hypothetical protein
MSTTITVKQVQIKGPSNHIARHKFPMPGVGEHGFYRSSISFNAFFNSIYRRNWSDEHLFACMDDRMNYHRSEWEIQRDAALPVYEHADIYAFFESIGYDRKTKKFKPALKQHDT